MILIDWLCYVDSFESFEISGKSQSHLHKQSCTSNIDTPKWFLSDINITNAPQNIYRCCIRVITHSFGIKLYDYTVVSQWHMAACWHGDKCPQLQWPICFYIRAPRATAPAGSECRGIALDRRFLGTIIAVFKMWLCPFNQPCIRHRMTKLK